MTSFAKDAEKVVELQRPDTGGFQLQQCRLAGIRIDSMDTLGRQQRVVEDVTASTGDDQQYVFGRQVEGLPVYSGVFPAGVIDQGGGVEGPKQALIEPIGQCRCVLQRSV
jgi:hypothetical protein